MRKVVFFDRDGTLIIDKIYLNDPRQIEYLPGVFEGLRKLRDIGFEFIVVTNQSGVPRGLVDINNLHKIHGVIRSDMAQNGVDILNFYYAPFLVESNHPMRKPNPGMILAGASDFNVECKKSWMVGDRQTDIEAGAKAGLRNIFLKGTEDHDPSVVPKADFVAENFLEVCEFIRMQTDDSG